MQSCLESNANGGLRITTGIFDARLITINLAKPGPIMAKSSQAMPDAEK